jgi:hypothetical protein
MTKVTRSEVIMKQYFFLSWASVVALFALVVLESAPVAGNFQDKEKKVESAPGRPAGGLLASADVVEHKQANVLFYFEVRFRLKNVSKKPITICDYGGNQPLQVRWLGPGGKMLKSHHYDWLRAADILALNKNHFVTIPAGGVRRIGPRGQDSGIIFQTVPEKPDRFGNFIQPGKQRVTVSYTNRADGKKFNVPNVWTGTVTANEVEIMAK